MLRIALRVATREVDDDVLSAEDASALAAMPARLARLEGAGADRVPVATTAGVFVDLPRARTLVSATSVVEPILVAVAEPGTGRILVAAGGHLAHHEWVAEGRGKKRDAPPRSSVRGAYTSAFRMGKPAEATGAGASSRAP
jgi:hypothetical protein